MRNLYLIIGALVLLLPGVAQAATCTSNLANGYLWTSETATLFGACAESADDDFVIDGERYVVNGDINITTGSLAITDGMLIVGPGQELQFGVNLSIAGGTLQSDGTVIAECEIVEPIDWTTDANAITVVVDCPTDSVDEATDWVVFDWATPPGGVEATLNGKNVFSGPGHAPTGAYRPSYNAGAWYPITAHTTNTSGVSRYSITYDINAQTINYTGTPYAGSRTIATAADPVNMGVTADVEACVTAPFGTHSALYFATGVSRTTIDADLGNRYLAFNESPDDTADVSDCSGLHAKVLHSREDPADNAILAGIQSDNGVFTDYTAAALSAGASDVVLLPADPADEVDAFYVGHEKPFTTVTFVMNAVASDGALTWEYYDGEGWTSLTGNITDNTNNFNTTGSQTVVITAEPTSWAKTTINNQGSLYYIRGRVTTDFSAATINADQVLITDGDVVYVAGDVCGCTSGIAHLTPGARRGDKLKIVRPAVIRPVALADATCSAEDVPFDCCTGAGAGTCGTPALSGGGGIQCTDGSLNANWTIFKSLGNVEYDSFTPALDRDANIALVLAGSAGATTECSGYITNSAILYSGTEATFADSAQIGVFSSSSAPDRFFPNDPLWDGSDFIIDKIYIADGAEDSAAGPGGTHGIFINGAKNFTVTRARLEHIDDDGIGSIDFDTSGTATDTVSYTYRHILNYENIATTDNSQSNFDFTLNDTAIDTDQNHFYLTQPQWVTMSDVLTVGGYTQAINAIGNGLVIDRAIFGGSFGSGTTPNVQIALNIAGAAATVEAAQGANFGKTSSPLVRDSILTNYVGDDVGKGTWTTWGRYYNDLFFGNEQKRQANGTGIYYAYDIRESLIDKGMSDGSSEFLINTGTTTADLMSTSRLDILDTAYRAESDWPMFSAVDNGAAGKLPIYNIQRVVGLITNITNGTGSPYYHALRDTFATTTINGGFFTQAGTGSEIFLDAEGTSTVATFDNICWETSNVQPGNSMWSTSTPDADLVSFTEIGPDVNEYVPISILVDDGSPSICTGKSRPNYLGFRNFGWAHAMLGDFTIRQLDRWTSNPDLVGVIRGTGGGSNRGF